MPVACALFAPFITGSAVGSARLPKVVAHHQAQCLRCQARGASIRVARRSLANLRTDHQPPPPHLEHRVMEAVMVASPQNRPWLPAAALAGVALAIVAAWRVRVLRAGLSKV